MAVSSPARVAASRANSLKSRGPSTAVGRLRTRSNAVKHGMAGRGVGLLPEDQALVDRKVATWAAELGATGDLERTCVALAASAYARVHRADLTEADRAARRDTAVYARKLAAASRAFVAATDAADAWPELIAAVQATGKFTLNQLKAARLISGAVEADPRVQQLRDLDARIQRRDPQALPDLLAWMRRQAEDAVVEAEERRAALAAAEGDPKLDAWVDKSKTGELLRRYRREAAREFHRALAQLKQLRKLPASPFGDEAEDTPRNEARSDDTTMSCAADPAPTAGAPGGAIAPAEGGEVGGEPVPATTRDAERPAALPEVEGPRNEARTDDQERTCGPIPASPAVVEAAAIPGDVPNRRASAWARAGGTWAGEPCSGPPT